MDATWIFYLLIVVAMLLCVYSNLTIAKAMRQFTEQAERKRKHLSAAPPPRPDPSEPSKKA